MKSPTNHKVNYSKLKRAWLITWENDGDHAKVENKFVTILNSRYSENTIKKILEFLYMSNSFSMYERFNYTKSKKNHLIKVQNASIGISYRMQKSLSISSQIPNPESMFIGDNPFLWARIVLDMETWIKDDNIECLHWKERQYHDWDGNKFIQDSKDVLEKKYLELVMS